MKTSSEGFVLFEQKELDLIEKKFKYITLCMVDSVGYYVIAGKDENVLLSTYLDKLNKLEQFLSNEYGLIGKIITHGEHIYTVFEKR